MQTIPYPQLKETLYHEQMSNGLNVYVLPKPGFQKTYATFATRYGSIDNCFRVEGDAEVRVPDGIAHFLEHKMFEEPSGDVFSRFAEYGASANAFTSFDRTVYLFSATENILANLSTLVDFVQNPYFTEQSVEKEKGIIGQEIKMYQDNPDWRSYFGLIEAMYAVHPLHIDIAGTIDSIAQITKDTLYSCYHTFYHPSNMILFVVGGVSPEQVFDLVRQNQAQKSFHAQGEIHRIFAEEPEAVKERVKTIQLPVSMPKCLIGFKERASGLSGEDLLRRELVTKLVLDSLYSSSSTLYQTLYNERLINDTFGHEYQVSPDYGFSMVGGDTPDSERLAERVKELLAPAIKSGIEESAFERSRRKLIGGFLRRMNSPEAIAGEFTKYKFRGADLFRVLPVYESITLEEANERMREHLNWDNTAISIVATGANG